MIYPDYPDRPLTKAERKEILEEMAYERKKEEEVIEPKKRPKAEGRKYKMNEPTIIGAQYKRGGTEEYGGKAYTFFCSIPVAVGDIVKVPSLKGPSTAKVCEVNISIDSVDESILPLMKTITELAEPQEANTDA